MKVSNRFYFYIFLLAVFAFSFASSFAAADEAETKKWVIVVADRISIIDIADPSLPGIGKMLGEGAVGLMNTRTAVRGADPAAACATVGAGVRAAGSARAPLSAHVRDRIQGVRVGETFETLTAEQPPGVGIVNLGIASLAGRNARSEWKARPGLLGAMLSDYGYSTAVVGNSDTATELHREAALIVMDSRGVVPFGNVSRKLLTNDPRAPFGLAFDMEALKEAFLETHLKSAVVVVDFGETSRAEAISADATEPARRIATERAMKRLDDFLGFVFKAVDRDTTRILLLVPTPSAAAVAEERTLTPILMLGPGVRPGLLTSASTRRAGIVANTDVAPTILASLEVEPPDAMVGAPIEQVEHKAPLAYLLRVHDKDRFVENHSWFVRVILFCQLGVLLLAYFTTLLLDRARPAWLGFMRLLILIVASANLAVLVVAGFDVQTTGSYLAAVLAVIGILVGFLLLLPGPMLKLVALSGLYAFAIVIDQLTGAHLIRQSVMGYYLQIGARYYGLGNEFMGFLIGGPLVFAALLLDASRGARPVRLFAVVFLLFVIAVVGAPQLGANTGGVVACGVAFLFMIWTVLGGRLGGKGIVFAFVAAGVLLAGFAVYDAAFSGEASHLGRLVGRAQSGGPHSGGLEEVARVALRKAGTNLHLLRVSSWSFLFTALSLMAIALYFFPMKRVEELFGRLPYFKSGFVAGMAGVLVAFLANDSGIAPGGTCLILPLAAIFTLLFSRK